MSNNQTNNTKNKKRRYISPQYWEKQIDVAMDISDANSNHLIDNHTELEDLLNDIDPEIVGMIGVSSTQNLFLSLANRKGYVTKLDLSRFLSDIFLNRDLVFSGYNDDYLPSNPEEVIDTADMQDVIRNTICSEDYYS